MPDEVTEDQQKVEPPHSGIQPSTSEPTQTQIQSRDVSQEAPQRPQPPDVTATPSGGRAPVTLPQPNIQRPQQPQPHHIFRDLFQTLSGGPNVTYKVDAQGNMVRTTSPKTRSQIATGIIAGALTGLAAGAGERGPGAGLRGFGKGFQAEAQQKEQLDEKSQAQAREDYGRHVAIAENNMRALNNAIQFGRLRKEDHDLMTNSYTKYMDDLRENDPEAIAAEPVSEEEAQDLKKYPINEYSRIPINTVPRLDDKGQHFADENGVPMWDNSYALIRKNVKETLVDDNNQPKQWVKDAVDWGLKGYPSSMLTTPISKATEVDSSSAHRVMHQVASLKGLQQELNNFADKLGIDNIDLKSLVKDDPNLLNAIQHFQRASGSSTQPDRQIDFMRQDPDSNRYVGNIIKLFGADNLEDYKQQREATAKAKVQETERKQKLYSPSNSNEAEATLAAFATKTKEGWVANDPENTAEAAAVATAKNFVRVSEEVSGGKAEATEEARLGVERKYQDAQDARIDGPTITLPPDTVAMGADNLAAYLQGKGVSVPKDFHSLYNVGAEYGDELNRIFPTRVSKGTNQTDANHALNYIHKYINPNFNATNFSAARKLNEALADPRNSPVVNAGTAVRHLNMLMDASKGLQNGDYRFLNKLRQEFNIETGVPAPKVFDTIMNAVNEELGKTFSGGTVAYEGQLKQLRDVVNKDQSPQTMESVGRTYAGLMSGRLSEINDQYGSYFSGRPLRVSAPVTQLLQKYGYGTPWSKDVINQNPNAPPINLLNETKPTNFKNGQSWMLKNGRATQVDRQGNPLQQTQQPQQVPQGQQLPQNQ